MSGTPDLTARLLAIAERQPDAPFLRQDGRAPMTWSGLARRIERLRGQFASWDVRRGDVVVAAAGERARDMTLVAALPAASSFLLLADTLTEDEYADLLVRTRARAVIVHDDASHALAHAAKRMPTILLRRLDDEPGVAGAVTLEPIAAVPARRQPPFAPPDTALVTTTSGTTGKPKLVPFLHRSLMAQVTGMGERLRMTPADVSWHAVPLHHAFGTRSGVLLCVGNGGSVQVLPESDIAALRSRVEDDAPGYLPLTYTVARELLGRLPEGPRAQPRRLRFAIVGAGAFSAGEREQLERALGAPVLQHYGVSEAGIISSQDLTAAPRLAAGSGRPIDAVVRLVDDAGRDVPPGAVGEVVVRGPQVCDGYLDDPEATAAAWVDGAFRTGDRARLDPGGELCIVDRIKDIINRGGEKISPTAIDEVLRAIPGIADAAAFGVPHPGLGEEVVAAVVLAKGATPDAEALLDRARATLGARATPKRLWFVDALPRNRVGKVVRSSLAALVESDERSAPDSKPSAGATSSPLEIALGGLWSAALRTGSVARDANFFMLGGDSLRGAALLDQVRTVFGVALPVESLFEDAGTVAGMARRIEAAREKGENPAARDAIRPRGSHGPVPLAHTQARAWFLQRLDPAGDAYHETRLWHLDGRLDVDALRAAFAAVVERQAMLRTRYVMVGGAPHQVVDPSAAATLEIVDLSGADGGADAALDAAVHERVTRPFDLAAAAPVRFALFRLGPDRHALLRVWHHIMSDGLSAPILERELSQAHAAARAGGAPRWARLPIDYLDYAAWQHARLGAATLGPALDAARARLAGVPTLALPTDYARPPLQSFRGAVVMRVLPAAAADGLKAVGRELGVSSFTVFFAAFAALLERLSGDRDFAVGTPIGARTRPELADLIGFFANTLAVRVDLSEEPTFAGLVGRMRDRLVEAYREEELPFERLVDALAQPRDPSRNPVFQVTFAMRESGSRGLAFEGVRVRRDPSRPPHAKFDLLLTLTDQPDGVVAHWEYCADLFDASTIERMARQFEALVGSAARAPDTPVGRLALMDEGVRARMATINVRAGGGAPSGTIVERFAVQAARHPHAKAFDALGYRELDEQSSRLAHAMRAAGVAKGDRVAVSRAKSADVAVAWLAVLKAGAAYLPIDGELPAERIAFMLRDAEVKVVVADDVIASRLAREGITILRPDAEGARIARLPATAPDVAIDAADPAYVIYTSGSTGTPKGVVVPHRAVLRLVLDTDYLQIRADDIVAQLANPAFDASTFEFWGALLNGARIAPIARDTALAPRALAAALASQRVSVMFITTALFNSVARALPGAFAPLRCVLFGGEAVEPHWVREVLRAGPPARLLHVYGPTEATTFATWHEVRAVDEDRATVPIGRPIAHTDAYVLRADGDLAAVGEGGELWLGGPGLAMGYLGRPDLTAERFVDREMPGSGRRRLYRTGDRVRLRDDGAIEYLGRLDRQVKVRGHRIELDEVESALAELPSVREAVVELAGATADTRQVVAWVVPADATGAPPNLLRELRKRLPDYMLPGAIVWMRRLPLNANGKIDRRALPPPGDTAQPNAGVRVEPRDMFESVIADLWRELLGVRVGVHDHFFEVGGHSLLAARLVDAIEQRTGYALPLTAMFTDDTVAGLASAIRAGARAPADPIHRVNEGGTRRPFVYLHGDFTGGGFYSQTFARALGADQPTFIVHPHGMVDAAIPDTIEAMARERLEALLAVQPVGPYLLGGHCAGGLVAFEMARQLEARGESVLSVVLIEAVAPDPGKERDDDAGGYVKIDGDGRAQVLEPRDRLSDAELRYARAIDRYAASRYDGHVVVVRAQHRLRAMPEDMGWGAYAGSVECHVLPGTHSTILTERIGDIAALVRGALARATGDTM